MVRVERGCGATAVFLCAWFVVVEEEEAAAPTWEDDDDAAPDDARDVGAPPRHLTNRTSRGTDDARAVSITRVETWSASDAATPSAAGVTQPEGGEERRELFNRA